MKNGIVENKMTDKQRVSAYLPKRFIDKEDGYLYLGTSYKLLY